MGGPRCFIELGVEFRKLGHTVDKFSSEDAVPNLNKLADYFSNALFTKRAHAFVRRNVKNYDVIMTSQGALTCSKSELGFTGVLVSRSDGLVHFYRDYERRVAESNRKKGVRSGTLAGNCMRWIARKFRDEVDATNAGFRNSDFITVLNSAELGYVKNVLGHGEKVLFAPNGLSAKRAEVLSAPVPAGERRQHRTVAFIGYWVERKGSLDLPKVARGLREKDPGIRFLLLGTGKSVEDVRGSFDPLDREALEIVPAFKSVELPGLLARATVGVLPSYLEGFGLAILEMLTAGIPSIAYDILGPADILKQFSPPLLAPAGDHRELARLIESVLNVSEEEYARLSARAKTISAKYRWDSVARDLCRIWNEAQHSRTSPGEFTTPVTN